MMAALQARDLAAGAEVGLGIILALLAFAVLILVVVVARPFVAAWREYRRMRRAG